jgi:hypothetical protein
MSNTQKYTELLDRLLQTAVFRQVQLARIDAECFNAEEEPSQRIFLKEKRYDNERAEMKVMLQKWADEL